MFAGVSDHAFDMQIEVFLNSTKLQNGKWENETILKKSLKILLSVNKYNQVFVYVYVGI